MPLKIKRKIAPITRVSPVRKGCEVLAISSLGIGMLAAGIFLVLPEVLESLDKLEGFLKEIR